MEFEQKFAAQPITKDDEQALLLSWLDEDKLLPVEASTDLGRSNEEILSKNTALNHKILL